MVSRECRLEEGVLITGSSQGIGKYLAFVFAENNHKVIIHGRDKKKLEEVCEEIKKFSNPVTMVLGDLRNRETLEKLYSAAIGNNISCLINNAAVVCPGLKLSELSEDKIQEMLSVNLIAPILLTQRIYPFFANKGSGVIININSIAGLEAKKQRSLYCASKYGLRGFSESLGIEAEEKGVSVASVYLSKVKLMEQDQFGMNPWVVARKIYKVYKNPKDTTIDGRPVEYKP